MNIKVKSRRKIIVIISFSLVLLFFIYMIVVGFKPRHFFMQFETIEEIKQYVEGQVLIDEATIPKVIVFLESVSIDNECYFYPSFEQINTNINSSDLQQEIYCSIPASRQSMIFGGWEYVFEFQFQNNILISVNVDNYWSGL